VRTARKPDWDTTPLPESSSGLTLDRWIDADDMELIQRGELLMQKMKDFPDRGDSPDITTVKSWSQIGRAMLGEHPGEWEPD
jgi:hypothetical protein